MRAGIFRLVVLTDMPRFSQKSCTFGSVFFTLQHSLQWTAPRTTIKCYRLQARTQLGKVESERAVGPSSVSNSEGGATRITPSWFQRFILFRQMLIVISFYFAWCSWPSGRISVSMHCAFVLLLCHSLAPTTVSCACNSMSVSLTPKSWFRINTT